MGKENLVSENAVMDLLGLKPKPLIERTAAVNIRKIRHVADDGTVTAYFNASDLIRLLQREYEVTESREVGKLLKVFRQMAGKL